MLNEQDYADMIRAAHRSAVRRLLLGAAVWALVAVVAGLASLLTYADAQEQAALTGTGHYYVWWGPVALAAWKIGGRGWRLWHANRARDELLGDRPV